jgi:2-keto-4-pentenoate hydratase/2-oxohepta-3-ene-1,7-dioic acid hydratase in catechol pathway
VTRDEIADPQNLDLWREVDRQSFQNGNTRTMVFGVAHLVAYVSQSVHAPGLGRHYFYCDASRHHGLGV